jgi:hypothetical protein
VLIAVWRWLLLILAAAAVAFTAFDLSRPLYSGDFGLTLSNGAAATFTVAGATGVAARAGLRAGDTLRLSADDVLGCTRLIRADQRCSFEVTRGGRARAVVLTAQPVATSLWVQLIQGVLRLSFLALGGLVAWRWFKNPAARALSTMLVAFGLAMTLIDVSLRTGWGSETFLLLQQTACLIVGSAAAVYFATLFPTRATGGVRVLLRRLCLPIALIAFVIAQPQFLAQSRWAGYVFVASLIYFALAAVIGLGVSFAHAEAADRQRMLWVLASFAVGLAGFAIGVVQSAMGGSDWASFGLLAIPFGLTYAIARHRVFGIAFVINRAVVYAVVSLVVVAAFLIAEWLLAQIFVNVSRTTNLALQLSVALVLGFAIRPIHARVDRVVDDVLFRARHLAEAAIRRFAHEANLVTDAGDLMDKTLEVLSRDAGASAAAIYRRGRDGVYEPVRSSFGAAAPVGENDWALLEMRAWHHPMEMQDGRSRLPGDMAFPMTVRGQLAGAIVCGFKRSGEAYAPDERDAVRVLAHEVGLALDALEVTRLRRELARVAGDSDLAEETRAQLRKIVE